MEKKENGSSSSFRYLLALYVALVVIAIPLSIFALPRFNKNMEENRVMEHFYIWQEGRRNSTENKASVYLWSYSGPVATERTIHKGLRDDLHLTLEALLLPLSTEEKQKGLISLIPEGTKLEGVTIRDKKAFVVLSEEFLESEDIEKAKKAIEMTLCQKYGTESLEIIINDNTLIK